MSITISKVIYEPLQKSYSEGFLSILKKHFNIEYSENVYIQSVEDFKEAFKGEPEEIQKIYSGEVKRFIKLLKNNNDEIELYWEN